MKKVAALLLVLVLAAGLLTISVSAEGDLKTGLAVVTSLASSKSATADADGLAQTDAYIVAVTVDQAGKIADCKIDSIQAKINFGANGSLKTDVATTFKTKNELGADYGMAKASPIGKEWNEQAAAMAEYVKGKTLDEVLAIGMDGEKHATDAALTASVTIKIDSFAAAIAKAVQNAQSAGAKEGDKLGLGISTSMQLSKAATADAAGSAQSYSFMTAVTYNGQGVVTSCILDGLQGTVAFDAKGQITSDINAAPQTKDELGDAYGMKKASKIGKEWNEQAAAFAAYAVGKNAEQISGIKVNEEGAAADQDLASVATISVTPLQQVVLKAMQAA
jgi:hypothetical protein